MRTRDMTLNYIVLFVEHLLLLIDITEFYDVMKYWRQINKERAIVKETHFLNRECTEITTAM